MATITRFEDLDIWREAVRVGVRIYKLSETGKLKRDFSAKDQLKRASISMSNNIAEGFEYNFSIFQFFNLSIIHCANS